MEREIETRMGIGMGLKIGIGMGIRTGVGMRIKAIMETIYIL